MDLLDLLVKIVVDDSEFSKGLDKVSKATDSMGKKVGNGLKTLGKTTIGAVATASTAMVGFGTASVKAGATFDSAMSQVAATMGVSVSEIDDLRNFAQKMGSETSFSATQAAEALNYMALAGYDADKSMAMLPNVLNLAAAGNIDLARASDMVTDAQSALGLSMAETNTMVDQMAKASSKSNTSVEQLGDAFLTIGATARGLSGGTQELSTVLGVLADNGIKGAEGGTHLRNAILSLQTPTKDGIAALEKLGMTYEDMYDSAGNLRSLPEIFQQMDKAMEGMTQQSKDAIISGVFNKTDLAAVNALIGTSSKRWDELSGEIGKAKGAAKEMADTQLDNLAGDITLFKSALEGAQIAISDKLTPDLRKFVKFGSAGLSRLTAAFKTGGLQQAMSVFGNILSDGLKKLTKRLPDFVKAGVELLSALGSGLIDNLDVITDAATDILTTLSEALVKGIPELVTAGSQILSNLLDGIITNLPNITSIIVEYITGFAQIIADNADKLIEVAIAIMGAIGQGLIQAMPILLEKLPEMITAFTQAIAENPEALLLLGPKILGFIFDGIKLSKGIFTNIGSFMSSEIVTSLGSSLMTGISTIGATLSAGLTSVATFATASMGTTLAAGGTAAIGMLASALLGGAVAAIAGLELGKKIGTWIFPSDAELYQHYSGITGTFNMLKDFFVAFKDFLGMTWDTIKNKATEASLNAANSFSDMKNRVSEKLNGLKSTVSSIFSALAKMALQWGRDLITQFINGIKQKWNDLKNTMSNMSATVRSYIHFSEPDVGPLSDFHTYAPDMMDLFARGIKDNTNVVTDQLDKSFDFGDHIVSDTGNTNNTAIANTTDTSGMWTQVINLLQTIANKELAVSPAGLLTIVREQNDIYKVANGGVGAI